MAIREIMEQQIQNGERKLSDFNPIKIIEEQIQRQLKVSDYMEDIHPGCGGFSEDTSRIALTVNTLLNTWLTFRNCGY